MKGTVKIIVGLFFALVVIGSVTILALRYLDVLAAPVSSLKKAFGQKGFSCCSDEDEEEVPEIIDAEA